MKFGFGQAVTRKEDDALLRGQGRYVADVAPPGTLHAVVLRSPHAHARFAIAELERVRAMPGVRLVLTAADIAGLGPLPTPGAIPDVEIKIPPYPILAREVVRHVGDAIAFVVADTLEQAKDAAEAIPIDWQPLPHVIGAMAALAPAAPQVWPDRPGNLAFEIEARRRRKTEAAFAQGRAHRLAHRRQSAAGHQLSSIPAASSPNMTASAIRSRSAARAATSSAISSPARCSRLRPSSMRVVTNDVGGGFGTKLFPYREYALAAVAAERLRKPVKWVADRSEHFLGDSHGRDNVTTAQLALDDRGRFLALDIDIVADMGAYLSCYGPYIPWLAVGMATGVYDIPAAHVRLRGVYTNTVPVDAYRGAGRPGSRYLIERLVDAAARELGVAPDALRRRNFIKPKAMPYTTPTGQDLRLRRFRRHLGARAGTCRLGRLYQTRWRNPSAPAACAASAYATYIEVCGGNGPETARVQLDRDGGVTVLIGSQSTGQGHATSYAQIVADRLDLAARQSARAARRHRRDQRPAPAPAARARFRWAASRSTVPAKSSPISSRSLPPRRWRRRRTISRSPTARCASPAPTASFHLPISPRIRRPSPNACARKASSAPSSRLTRTAPTSPRSRSIRRPAPPRSSATSSSTTSAPRSIRCCSPARCMAAPCRASARR